MRFFSFAVALPMLAIAHWTIVLCVPTMVIYFSFERAAHGEHNVHLQTGKFTTIVPPKNFFVTSLDFAGFRAEKSISVVDAPGVFVDILFSLLIAGKPGWYPLTLTSWAWRSLVYPFFALPSWIFAGRGLDHLIRHSRPTLRLAIPSLVLALLLLALALGLRFGTTESERQANERGNWLLLGFFLWSVLFALPFLAWLRSKLSHPIKPL